MTKVFLTAEWRYLAMLNYRVPQAVLEPFVPRGTELDLWNGIALVSVVGFLFRDTRVLGMPIPFHRTFEEINLRFYVHRTVGREVRRAVTFIRELVPRRAIAAVARLAYNEPYLARPMRHRIAVGRSIDVQYEWKSGGVWAGVRVTANGPPSPLRDGSEEEFITEHYWGYTRQRNGSTVEYEVRHPRWNVWHADTARLDGDLSAAYPSSLVGYLSGAPDSALLADGSAVTVHTPVHLDA